MATGEVMIRNVRKLTLAQTRKAIAALGIELPYIDAFRLPDREQNIRYEFHKHGKHQLLAPQGGLLLLETRQRLHTLAPGQAVWIPAGAMHATTFGREPVHSLFFPPARYPSRAKEARVLVLSGLARELLAAMAHEPIGPRKIQRGIFDLLHHLCEEVLEESPAVSLPRPRSPQLAAVIHAILPQLDRITPDGMARIAGMSGRTLRRRFQDEVGLPPEKFLRQARLTRAMQLLLEKPSWTLAEVAMEAGYENQSAFGAAFRKLTGASPGKFRSPNQSQK